MKQSNKHIPVLLEEVIREFKQINKNTIVAIDCTLGQGGHSYEIYKLLDRGVLISIDLNKNSIEWTAKFYGLEYQEKDSAFVKYDGVKKWNIINDDFSNLGKILIEKNLETFDFLIADLGFSNFELKENLGISYAESNQELNMNYSSTGIKAKDALNGYDSDALSAIFEKYFQKSHDIDRIINKIKTFRGRKTFEKNSDLNACLSRFPDSFKIKVYQALRSYVNQEESKLSELCKIIISSLSQEGIALIISFNEMEEEIINKTLGKHQIVEPNIKEIIDNPQSRSAKLHIYKKQNRNTEEKDNNQTNLYY